MKKGFSIFSLLALSVAIIFVIDSNLNNYRIYNYIAYSKSCDLDVKECGYFLAIIDNKYVIGKHDRWWDSFLCSYATAGINKMPLHIRHPSAFSDSCSAKGFLVAYLKQEQSKIKPIPKVQIVDN